MAAKSRGFLSCSMKLFPSHAIPASVSSRLLLNHKACIELLKECKFMSHLKQIQAQIFTRGLQQNTHILHKLMAFTTSADLDYAERIFAGIESPTLFIYNVMINASVKMGSFRRALFLFDELRVRGLWPDNYTYPFVFKAVQGLRLVADGEKIHGFVIKSGISFDCYANNSIMDMYGEFGRVNNFTQVFDEMPERDLVSWNVLISGLVKCNRYEDAIAAYRRMRCEGTMQPDEATVVSTLSACTVLKKLDIGREIHEYVSTQLGYTVIIGNALVDMYAKCGFLDVARKLFDAMPKKNVICWTSMVSGCLNCGQLDEARELFARSPVRDLVLWTAMINGYVQFNRVEEAIDLFREMQMERIRPDNFTLVALLTGCAQLGALEHGEWIHGYIKENGIAVDAIIGTALIEMYAKCGCIQKSMEIYYCLKEKDTATCTSLICALAMNGNTAKALELFSEMIQAGVKPDDITFIGVLSACGHRGLVEEGRRYFSSMTKDYQIEPKLEHYGCLIDLLARAGLLDEAEDLIATMPNKDDKIIAPLYGSLLAACCNYGNVDMGERIAKRLMEIESRDSSIHTVLANIYASADKWEDATKVRRRMRALKAKKSPGCSLIEVDRNVCESVGTL